MAKNTGKKKAEEKDPVKVAAKDPVKEEVKVETVPLNTDVVGAQLIDSMPDPQPNVTEMFHPGLQNVDTVSGEYRADKPAPTGFLDRFGRAFSSELHKIGANGEPVLTKTNLLKVLPGKSVRQSRIGGITSNVPAPEPESTANYEACGLTAAHSIFFLSQGLGGKDWEPSESESKYMCEAWTAYFRAKGITDIPPGVMLLTALISYAAPRFKMVETQNRLSKSYSWIKSKFVRGANNGSHVSGGND